MKNEAAERLRKMDTTTPFDLLPLIDAALAEERRHVIEQIQERIYPDMLGDPIGKDGESMLTILDDLSTPEQKR